MPSHFYFIDWLPVACAPLVSAIPGRCERYSRGGYPDLIYHSGTRRRGEKQRVVNFLTDHIEEVAFGVRSDGLMLISLKPCRTSSTDRRIPPDVLRSAHLLSFFLKIRYGHSHRNHGLHPSRRAPYWSPGSPLYQKVFLHITALFDFGLSGFFFSSKLKVDSILKIEPVPLYMPDRWVEEPVEQILDDDAFLFNLHAQHEDGTKSRRKACARLRENFAKKRDLLVAVVDSIHRDRKRKTFWIMAGVALVITLYQVLFFAWGINILKFLYSLTPWTMHMGVGVEAITAALGFLGSEIGFLLIQAFVVASFTFGELTYCRMLTLQIVRKTIGTYAYANVFCEIAYDLSRRSALTIKRTSGAKKVALGPGLQDEEEEFRGAGVGSQSRIQRLEEFVPSTGRVKNFDAAIESLKAVERHEKEKLLQTLVFIGLYSFFVFSSGMILLR